MTEPYHPFPVTHWSLVERAGHDQIDVRQRALEAILEQYLPALRSHLVSRRWVAATEIDDLVQSFIVSKVLQRDVIAQADRSRGRFRAFIRTSFDRFVQNELRDRRAHKRKPMSRAVSLEGSVEPASGSPPLGTSFDVEWARQVLTQALERMKQECKAKDRRDIWEVFNGRTLEPLLHQREPTPYSSLVERFGFASPSQASNALLTAHRMFERNLRQSIGCYELSDHDIDMELADLRLALSRSSSGGMNLDTEY